MAHDDESNARTGNGVLDLKTVLGAACTGLVLLAGVTWGVISSQRADEIDINRSTNAKQWERLADLNNTLIELRTKHDNLKQTVDDQESRLRTLEAKR